MIKVYYKNVEIEFDNINLLYDFLDNYVEIGKPTGAMCEPTPYQKTPDKPVKKRGRPRKEITDTPYGVVITNFGESVNRPIKIVGDQIGKINDDWTGQKKEVDEGDGSNRFGDYDGDNGDGEHYGHDGDNGVCENECTETNGVCENECTETNGVCGQHDNGGDNGVRERSADVMLAQIIDFLVTDKLHRIEISEFDLRQILKLKYNPKLSLKPINSAPTTDTCREEIRLFIKDVSRLFGSECYITSKLYRYGFNYIIAKK